MDIDDTLPEQSTSSSKNVLFESGVLPLILLTYPVWLPLVAIGFQQLSDLYTEFLHSDFWQIDFFRSWLRNH